jgi:hypothetical protein
VIYILGQLLMLLLDPMTLIFGKLEPWPDGYVSTPTPELPDEYG